MYILLPIILLIFPRSGHPAPAQHIPSLSLTTPDPHTLNTVGFEPIDPQFVVLPQFWQIPLDEDQWLLTAMDFMGQLCAQPTTDRIESSDFRSGDPDLQLVELAFDVHPMLEDIEVRYLIWGLYRALRGVFILDSFSTTVYQMTLRGVPICALTIKARSDPWPQPGWSSTNTLRQMSSSNQSDVSVTESPDGTKLNVSVPHMAPHISIGITYFGRDLPKKDIILTIVESLLTIADPEPLVLITAAIIVTPPHSTVQLHILPFAVTKEMPLLWVAELAEVLKDIPRMLWRSRWAEIHFDILVHGVPVALGLLVDGRPKLGSGQNGSSIN